MLKFYTQLSIIITPFWINKISGPTFDLENLGAVARQDLFMAGIQKETLDRWLPCPPWPRERAMLPLWSGDWNHWSYYSMLSIHQGSMASHLPSSRPTASTGNTNNSHLLATTAIVVDRPVAARLWHPLRACIMDNLEGREFLMLPGCLRHSGPADAGDQGRDGYLDSGRGAWPRVFGNRGIARAAVQLSWLSPSRCSLSNL